MVIQPTRFDLDKTLTPELVQSIGGKDRWMFLSKDIERPPCLFFNIEGTVDLEIDSWRIEIEFDKSLKEGHDFIVWLCVRGSRIAFKHVKTLSKLIALYELWKGEPLPGIKSVLTGKLSMPPLTQPVRITGDE